MLMYIVYGLMSGSVRQYRDMVYIYVHFHDFLSGFRQKNMDFGCV